MATIKNTIALQDKMTPVLRSIISAMSSTLTAMEATDKASKRAFTNAGKDAKAASDAIRRTGQAVDGSNDSIRETPAAISRAKKAVDDATKAVDDLTSSFTDSSGAAKEAADSIDDINRNTGKLPDQQKKVESGFSGWQKAIIVANQGLELFKSTLGKLGLIDFDRAFARMDTMHNFERVMGIITGNTDAAKVVLNELNQAVLGTAYGLDVAAQASQNFVTRGVGLKKSTQLITTWADAVAFYGKGTNDQLEDVTDALGKMISKGKIEMYQLNRLTRIGINATDMYAKATGRNVAEVQDDLSKGVISAVDFINTVTEAMESGENGVHKVTGAAKAAGGTWATTFANMKAAGARGMIGLIESIDRALEALGFEPLMVQLKNIGIFAENLFKNIGTAIHEFVETNSERILYFVDLIRGVWEFISENWNLIPPILIGIASAFAAAQVEAWMYAIANGAVNTQLLLMNIRLAAVGLLIGAAVYLWTEFGIAGKILAIILGVLAGVILVATIATHAFNAALWANPIVWVIALVVALIAIIVVLVLWIIDLWQTNMDFKYGIIKIWNDILGFFDQVPIFFQMVGYGIADAFGWAKVKVMEIMESMANGVIGIINKLIGALNKIPGVAIDPLNELTFAASAAAEEEAKKQNRAANLEASRDAAAAKAASRQAEMEANRAKDEANLAAKKAAAEAEKNKDYGVEQEAPLSWDDLNLDEPDFNFGDFGMDGAKLGGGKLDKVGKIEDDVSITDEDIKLLKDVAATEFVNKFTTLRPEMQVTFGDVRETADVRKILEVLEDMVEDAYASVLVGEGV